MNYYDGVAGIICELFTSKEPEQKQLAPELCRLEYENIYTGMEISLQNQKSIWNIYRCLSKFIDTTQDHKRGILLGEMVLKKIEAYPAQILEGQSGVELVGVIDNIACRFLFTKQYARARDSYLKALEILQGLSSLKEKQKAVGTAGIYHQLGMVAQKLREFDEARKNYQKALEIYIEFNDPHSQGIVVRSLKRLEEEERKAEGRKAEG